MVADPQFLTPKEVAGILGVHQKTVHQWLRAGKLSGTKISYRAWRIPRSALEQFITQSSNKPSTGTSTNSADESKNTTPRDSTIQEIMKEKHTEPDLAGMDTTIKMKHYLRDIMGEDSLDHTRNSQR